MLVERSETLESFDLRDILSPSVSARRALKFESVPGLSALPVVRCFPGA